jgi:hypothetical protein
VKVEIQLHSFNFGTGWRRVVNLTTRMPSRKLGGPNVLQKKKLPTGIQTELSRLVKEKKFIQNCSSEM